MRTGFPLPEKKRSDQDVKERIKKKVSVNDIGGGVKRSDGISVDGVDFLHYQYLAGIVVSHQ